MTREATNQVAEQCTTAAISPVQIVEHDQQRRAFTDRCQQGKRGLPYAQLHLLRRHPRENDSLWQQISEFRQQGRQRLVEHGMLAHLLLRPMALSHHATQSLDPQLIRNCALLGVDTAPYDSPSPPLRFTAHLLSETGFANPGLPKQQHEW